MDAVVFADSPLAAYLQEDGHDGQPDWVLPAQAVHGALSVPPELSSSAPTLRRMGGHALTVAAALLRRVTEAITSPKFPQSDCTHFLEHFRYIIVASQLLSEHVGRSPSPLAGPRRRPARPDRLPTVPPASPSTHSYNLTAGALALVVGAPMLASVVQSLQNSIATGEFTAFRASALLFVLVFIVTALFRLFYRQALLRQVRRQAIDAASVLLRNLHALEASLASSLALIQEVELISRGYRISMPLPPVSRLEGSSSTRRCTKLRLCLYNAFSDTVPALQDGFEALKGMIVEESDLAKYLEIYDISDADLCDASFGFPQYMHEDGNDHQSLKYLRVASARQSILRRLLLCALLAIPADMTSANLPRWEQVTGRMLTIAEACGSASNRLTEAQLIEEVTEDKEPTGVKEASNSQHEQMRNQLRRLTTLSHGIRSLQAKLHMLREESAKALDEHTPPCIPAASEGSAVPQADRHLHLPGAFESTKHEDLAEHSPRRTARDTKCDDEDKEHIEHSSNDADLRASSSRLHTAFDSIGQDLQQLTQTWSAGRAMFELSSSPPSSRRQSKRLSNYRLSLEARMSPVLSLTGTTVVDDGSPSIPLSRLFGRDASVSPISRDFGSRPLSCLSVSSAGADDSPASNAETDEDLRPALDAGSKKAMIEQVFEAVATPRTRLPHQRQARHQRHPTPLILLSPESRAQREKDELERRQKADLASASRNMVAELKSVICARSPDPIDAG